MQEREAIRLRRAAGEPRPWTSDPILATYRFTNVRREDDRVTAWIREHIREPYDDHPNLWIMLCLARFVNWPPTLQYLMDQGAWPTKTYDATAVTAALDELTARAVKVWTGAYMIKGDFLHRTAEERRKPFYVATTVLGETWKQRHAIKAALPQGLEATYRALTAVYGWGPFLTYQAIVDMRWTSLLMHASDLEWAAAGPGTLRGLNRVAGRPAPRHLAQEQALAELREIYPVLRKAMPTIDFSDVLNIMCETDKYARAKAGEGRPRSLYRSEEWPEYKL